MLNIKWNGDSTMRDFKAIWIKFQKARWLYIYLALCYQKIITEDVMYKTKTTKID